VYSILDFLLMGVITLVIVLIAVVFFDDQIVAVFKFLISILGG
jgi:FtsH-binding integral membrane protein